MTTHYRRWAIGLVLAGTLLSRTSGAAVPAGCDPRAKPANLGFTLKDIAGKDVGLAAYKGKVILLDFWATWCAPCKVEIPWFVEFYKKYQSQGFVVVGVSIDDSVEKLKPFVAQYKMNYPVLIGDGRDDLKDAYGTAHRVPDERADRARRDHLPTHIGYAPKEQFERDLKALLPAS